MPRMDWHSSNQGRNYPFIATPQLTPMGGSGPAVPLPMSVLTDAGFILGLLAAAAPNTAVDLSTVQVSELTTRFEFTAGASTFVFEVGEDVQDTTVYASGTVTGIVSSLSGQAFISIGSQVDLRRELPEGVYTVETGQIEPALVQSRRDSLVRRVNFANDPSVIFPPCLSSGESSSLELTDDVLVVASSRTGVIRFTAGYNATVEIDANRKRLTVGAYAGAGAGYPCSEVPRGSDLSDMPEACDCRDVVYTVNGGGPSPGGDFFIHGGKGVEVAVADGNPHRVIITVDVNAVLRNCG